MRKLKTSKNPKSIAKALGLPSSTAVEWEVRYQLTQQILATAGKSKLTVTEIAKRSGTSRARITLILKSQTEGISVDVLLRVLGALGKTVKLTFKKAS